MTIATEIEKKSKGISNNSPGLMHLHRSISQCKYRLNRRAERLKKKLKKVMWQGIGGKNISVYYLSSPWIESHICPTEPSLNAKYTSDPASSK